MTTHPERRAGQRWRWQQGVIDKEFTIERRNTSDDGWVVSFPSETPVSGYEPWFGDRDWAGTLWTLTLISDVPAVAPVADDPRPSCIGKCDSTAACDCRKPAPQPKPAKAVCRVRFSASGCFGEVLDRVLTKAGIAVPCCETCMVAQDGQFARSKIHTVGTPYTGPERLERPKLAHQSGMHDDDLIGGAR